MHKALVLTGVAGLLVVTACSKSDSGTSTPAAGTPTTSAAATAAATTSAAASTGDPSKLGPDGYGGIKLGDSLDAVKKAGIKLSDETSSCPYGTIEGPSGIAQVDVSKKIGVFRIGTGDFIPTAEGVKLGAPLAVAKKAYPTLATDGGLVPVPGNPKANYQIDVSDGRVGPIELKYIDSISPDC